MRVHSHIHEEFVKQFNQGNEEGLEFFYSHMHAPLSHYANRWVKDRDIAEDIASEAIIRTWKFHEKLDSYAAIKSYLYKATGRLSQRYVGKEAKRTKIHKEVFPSVEVSSTPFDQLVKTETYALLRAAVHKLAPGIRRVMTMHYLDGKKLYEIATELNLSPKTISSQKEQGLKALRKVLLRPFLIIISLLGYFSFL